jgi:hypothetical protein
VIHPAKNATITCDFCGRKVAEIVKSLFRKKVKVGMSHITIPFKYSDFKQTVKNIHICIMCHEHIAAEISLKNAREKEQDK